jgi:membrane protease YdiL (CAAX protease family)
MAEKSGGEPSYWAVIREPRYALVLVLPMMAVYQVGLIALARLGQKTYEVRNAADLFLENVLRVSGVGGQIASGAVVIGVLVGWQVLSRRRWAVRSLYVVGMLLEALFYALILLLSYQLVTGLTQRVALVAGASLKRAAGQVVLSLGAGVYEEFLFRLVLIGCLLYLLRWARAGRVSSAVFASLLAAVTWSLFHVVGEEGWGALAPLPFLVRSSAGLVFAGLFFGRGFGITTATHAFFNVIPILLRLVWPS